MEIIDFEVNMKKIIFDKPIIEPVPAVLEEPIKSLDARLM